MNPDHVRHASDLSPFKPIFLALGLALFVGACGNKDQKVGGFTNDLTGNEIEISALPDPKLPQVTCYFGSFNRSLVDRLGNGNWFENPSNTAVDCRATGPIEAASLKDLPKNAEVFSKGSSLLFKSIALRRIVDVKNETIVYVSYSRELVGASAKLGMSVVPVTPTPEPAAAPKAP